MTGDAIKRALEVAARASVAHHGELTWDHLAAHVKNHERHNTAAAIAAFLEALPPVDVMMAQRPHDPVDPGGPHSTSTLAAAVRRAAGGG
jgi:hypothetical protein